MNKTTDPKNKKTIAENNSKTPVKVTKSSLMKSEVVNKPSDKVRGSNLKGKVVKVQKGVTDSKGKSGSYIYYKDPAKGKFNVKEDREFVTDSGMTTAKGTQRMNEYEAEKAKKKSSTM